MILAVDVDYRADGSAVAAGVQFAEWTSDRIGEIVLRRMGAVAPYEPGRFFARELPCLAALVADLPGRPGTIVVDGYVFLGEERRPGLGAHLHAALGGAVPVIGIAKTRFAGTPAEAEVLRGTSLRPLYVTAIGIDEGVARDHVRSMHGAHRIPAMLAAADRACREAP